MAEIKRKTNIKKSQGMFIKDSIMTGISYMIPVIVGGGVLQAIAKMMGVTISEAICSRLIPLPRLLC